MASDYKRRLEDKLTGIKNKRQREEMRHLFEELHHTATTDPLTGLLNRAGFEEAFEKEMTRLHKYKDVPVSILFIDIDNFKRVNDSTTEGYRARDHKLYKGHDAGDKLLQDVAYILQRCVRGGDALIRWGGEEIAVLLPLTETEGAKVVADRICRRVKTETGHTVSVGISNYPSTTNTYRLENLLHDADVAMYASKRAGKNRYTIYRPGLEG